MQGFFYGFDKVKVILGTSVFYLAALAIIVISILYSQNKPFVKMSDFYKVSELNPVENVPVQASYRSNSSPLGYSTTIELGSEISFEVVAAIVGVLMRSKDLEPVSMILNCSKIDCRVEFTTVDDNHRKLAKRANDQFQSYLPLTSN